jgi:hypothetical protein
MTLLKEAIRQIGARPLPPLKLREITAVHQAAAPIVGGDGVEGQREDRDYDKIARKLMSRLLTGDRLADHELRDAAWCLWQTETPLANWPETLQGTLEGIEQSSRKPPGRALASSFLYFFATDRTGIPEASAALCRMAERLGRPWAELQSEYELLDWRDGPQRVASRALELRKSPTEVLARGGLRSKDSLSGYVEACTAELLKHLARQNDIPAPNRLALVEAVALNDRGNLIFPKHGPWVANALLLPFSNTEPHNEVRQRYLELLLRLFDDPRLSPGNWVGMPEAALIVERWLTRESLLQFLAIVDQVAEERMFSFRRKFWEAVYRKNLISAAWVVLDPAATRLASHAFQRKLKHGVFDASVESGQCVLLMKIGRGVVAEWSQNGRCNIWNDSDSKGAPALYNRLPYTPGKLRSNGSDRLNASVFAVTHWPHDGPNSWQSKVAAKLHQMTGVRLTRSDWK